MFLDNADGDADVLLEEQLKDVDPKVVEFWEYLQSKYNKDSEDEEQLKNYKRSLCFAAFVLLCTKTKNHKATTPFAMHLGLFLHRKGTSKPVWNLLSSLRLSISYQATKNLLKNKLPAVRPKSQPTDIIIMAADNNDFWSKPGNRGARAEKKATMVHTVQRLTIGTEKYQGRRMLSVGAPNLDELEVDSILTEASNESIIFINPRKENLESSTVAVLPLPLLRERIGEVWNAFSVHHEEKAQHEYFQSLWDEARDHILPRGCTERRTLGDYPYLSSKEKIPATPFTVFEPEVDADAKRLTDLARLLDNFWNMAKDKDKVIGLLYGDENLIEFAASCKKKDPEKFK